MTTTMKSPTYTWNDTPIPEKIIENWQKILNLIAKVMNVPAGLIMRVHPPTIEVFLASQNQGNPYHPHEIAELPGLYCNTVMNTKKHLLIPNALKDPQWDKNPDIELGMISYLGYPLIWPNGDMFGTICVLDSKENAFNLIHIELLTQFKEMVQNHLELIVMHEKLTQSQSELEFLHDIVPKCSYCSRIRVNDHWYSIDEYLRAEKQTEISHSICPECLKKEYPNL